MRDYLWRWDTDWFWCSRAFGVQNPRVRRLVPSAWLRSDVYRKLVAFERRHGVVRAASTGCAGARREEYVVQDVEVPVDRAAEFLDVLPARDPDRARSGCARCGCATATRRGTSTRSTPTRPT